MKKSLSSRRKNILQDMLMSISLIFLVIISILIIWYNNKIYFIQYDSYFHLSRFEELLKSRYIFPTYALNSFNELGSAVTLMYPYVLFYPMVWIFKIIRSIKYTILIYYALGSYITALICFFSGIKFIHNKLVSYIFAIIYTFSGEFIAMYFYSHVTDVGVYLSAIFLPLVIFGILYLIKDGNWLMLSIGMSLILFSNIISVAFLSLFLLIMLIININLLNRHKLVNLVKAVILMALTTACVWIPILKINFQNHLNDPTTNGNLIGVYGIRGITIDALKNSYAYGCQSLSIFSIIGIIFGIIFYKKLSKSLRKLFIFAIVIFVFGSRLFPWGLVSKVVALRHLQTTLRLLVFPQLIFEFILSYLFVKFINKHKIFVKYLFMSLFLVIIVLIQLQAQDRYIQQGNIISNNNKSVMNIHRIVNSSNHIRNMDYWPTTTLHYHKLLNKNDIINNGKLIHFIPRGSGNYNVKITHDIKSLRIPFICYYGTKYKCYINGKSVHLSHGKYQLLSVRNNIKRGYKHIYVKALPNDLFVVSRIISLISVSVYVFIMLRKKKYFRRKSYNVK